MGGADEFAPQVPYLGIAWIGGRQGAILRGEDRFQPAILEILDPSRLDRVLAVGQDDHLVRAEASGLIFGQQVAFLVAFGNVDATEWPLAESLGFRGDAVGGFADGGRQFGLGPLLGRGKINLEARAALVSS